jgi:hypothetical protein
MQVGQKSDESSMDVGWKSNESPTNVGWAKIGCHYCDDGRRCYTIAPGNTTLRQWSTTCNVVAMADNALQLMTLWRWLVAYGTAAMTSSSWHCGNGRRLVVLRQWSAACNATTMVGSLRRYDHGRHRVVVSQCYGNGRQRAIACGVAAMVGRTLWPWPTLRSNVEKQNFVFFLN